MGKNFLAMPVLLKLLTIATTAVPIFCVLSLFPNQLINVFGQHVDGSEWWTSGAGFVTANMACFMLVASLLILNRSPYARVVYVLGTIVMSFSAPIIAYLLRIELSVTWLSLISNLVLVMLIALYLYINKDVRAYFETT